MSKLEEYFHKFRKNIIGIDHYFTGSFGRKKIIYADWTATGRMYGPIEDAIVNYFGPFVANTHTETSYTGSSMTHCYHTAKEIIKKHVNANAGDCLIAFGSGMTGVINKFQRILGLRIPEKLQCRLSLSDSEKPIVFVTHMEHHSNHTSWLETIADVVKIQPTQQGLVDLDHFSTLLEMYKDRPLKIAAITACSNVTGIATPYHQIARMIHQYGGYCFVDFACAAPYANIDMHPPNAFDRLDAIYFSPHKFLGGPGTPGIIIFNSELYNNRVPDNSGGGTVKWTNPWNEYAYIDDIEEREDGGTPPFLQTIKVAMCIQLKERMGVQNIQAREQEINQTVFESLEKIENLHILAGQHKERQSIFSFFIEDVHYNLVVALLNDLFGIQARGGCSCAGTYGHYLLNLNYEKSHQITRMIDLGNFEERPGWVRISFHPTDTTEQIRYVMDSIAYIAREARQLAKEYTQVKGSHLFKCNRESRPLPWLEIEE